MTSILHKINGRLLIEEFKCFKSQIEVKWMNLYCKKCDVQLEYFTIVEIFKNDFFLCKKYIVQADDEYALNEYAHFYCKCQKCKHEFFDLIHEQVLLNWAYNNIAERLLLDNEFLYQKEDKND
jgi:hypothetical protein